MYVVKRSGKTENVSFDKITARIRKLCYGLNMDYVDPVRVSQKVCAHVYKGVKTSELDELAAETAMNLSFEHPDYGTLAARISVSNAQKKTPKSFAEMATILYTYTDSKKHSPLLSKDVYEFIMDNKDALESAIIHDRDEMFDYFGFKTLQRSHLLRIKGQVIERPQHMWMRVACGLHCGHLERVIETYELLSTGWFTHASPTLFNAGTPHPQLSSCFLLCIKGDDIGKIYDTVKDCALISKGAGGIGLAIHNIREEGAYISGTNGDSNGIAPMIQVFNATAKYVDQGGGKRPGAFAIYLEPWHPDIEVFLELRKNDSLHERRARDLFYGLWIPDLFMRRVQENKSWSLFSPKDAPGLDEVWGEAFDALYEKYEETVTPKKRMLARELWNQIMVVQQEGGIPYMLYKDACNRKSNHQHLGTIKCSNLCTEIIEYSSKDEIAVCNLASLALPKFVDVKTRTFNHQKLFEVTLVVVRNLNIIIDINAYPVPEARKSNLRHRPLGIGFQGLADAFLMLRLPFESDEARKLNRHIVETMYFAALTASNELAQKEGPYESYEGSPVQKGILQFDMWGVQPELKMWDWKELRHKIEKYGIRNSLLLAPMPTATTSQILGNSECFEPYASNLYVRQTLAGNFICVNKFLLQDLVKLGLWTPEMRNKLIAYRGSVQDIEEIPLDVRLLYKTVWEIKGKTLIDMAADRGAFICQSQSLNQHMANPTTGKLTSMHFHAWKKGLKTGMYYLRSRPAYDAIQFTVDQQLLRMSEKRIDGDGKESKKKSHKDGQQESSTTKSKSNIPSTDLEMTCSRKVEMGEACMNCTS